uniref:Helicase ATP-binding domain-containing protein n=1 Tax=Globodera pallida TaxID=36090 RepID=A0A183CEG4_GLOPA
MISKEAKEAQRLERERLNRIEKNKKELNAAVYAPIIAGSSSINLDDQGFDEPNQSDDDDDLLFVGEVIAKKKTDLVELGSSEDEVEEPSSIANVSDYASFRMNQFSQLRQSEQFRFRRRRRSADYDKTETGADGRLLVNAGKPDSDPEVFVTPHLTNVLQPHQIGGVKFMYDNIIESLDAFHKSSGFGCILAHSMGLGKSIQAITFVEIFIRITGQRRVLIICPVNVLQNWHNEFNRWLPKISAETALPIRQFELFVLGDSVKSMESRAQMIDNWHQSGGVLLMGYEMFRLLVHQCELLGEKGQRKKPSKKQPLRTVFDLADGLERISEEGRVKIVLKDELQKNIRRALLNPGPDLVICDEGHRIKNLNTEVSCALSSINTKRRIVLTGYPIQNNLMEYFCMVEFVRPSYLGSKRDFQLMFDKPIRNGLCTDSTKSDIKLAKQRIHVLCDMLRGFVQRRSQHLLKKILPESREFIVLLRKSELQHSLYRAFHHFACGQINAGESSFNPLKAFAICMKIVNHPDMLLAALKKHQLKSQFARVTNGCEGSNKTGLCQPSTSVQCPFDLGSSAIHSTTSITAFANDRAPIQPIKNPSPPIGEAPQPFANGNSSSLCSSGEPYYGVSGHQWQSNQFFAPPIQMQHRPPPLHPHYQQTFGQQFAPHQQHYNFFQQPPPFQPHPYQQQQQQNQLNSQFFPPVPPPQQQQYRHQFFTMDYANFDRCNQPTPRWYPSNSGNNNAGMVSNENLQQHFFNNPFDQQTSSTFDSSTHQTQPKKETAETNEQPQQQMDNLQQFCFDSVELPCVNDKGGQKNGGDRQKQTTAKKKQQLIGKGEECDLLSDEFLFEGGNSIDLEWAEPLLCNHATGIVEHSSKMFVAMAIISETIRRGEKLLLFSQSVVTLNLIEQFLKKHSGEPVGPDGEPVQFVRNETYCRLDGSTSGSDREKLINRTPTFGSSSFPHVPEGWA